MAFYLKHVLALTKLNCIADLEPYSNIELVLETVDRWFSGFFSATES